MGTNIQQFKYIINVHFVFLQIFIKQIILPNVIKLSFIFVYLCLVYDKNYIQLPREGLNMDNPVQTQCSSGYGNLYHTELR